MVQWINILRNNGLVDPMHTYILYEKTGHLSHSGTGSYDREARRPLGR